MREKSPVASRSPSSNAKAGSRLWSISRVSSSASSVSASDRIASEVGSLSSKFSKLSSPSSPSAAGGSDSSTGVDSPAPTAPEGVSKSIVPAEVAGDASGPSSSNDVDPKPSASKSSGSSAELKSRLMLLDTPSTSSRTKSASSKFAASSRPASKEVSSTSLARNRALSGRSSRPIAAMSAHAAPESPKRARKSSAPLTNASALPCAW